MVDGRLEIYQAAHKIIDFLVKNGADNENRRLTRQEVCIAAGLDEELFEDAYEDLLTSGSVVASNSEDEMWVTTKGMEACYRGRARNFLDAQNEWLENFSRSLQQPHPPSPPSSNVININGPIYNSQFQQGSDHSSQTGSSTSIPIDELRSLVADLRASFSKLAFSDDNKGKAEAAIEAIGTQLDSSPPNQGTIRKSLESLKRVFEGAASSALGSGLAREIAQVIAYLDAA